MAHPGEIANDTYDSANHAVKIVPAASSALAVPTTVGSGRKVVTTAGTAVTLASTTTAKSVTVTAETDNTGVISVGASNVVAALATRIGTPLNAGESFSADISDLASVYIDSTVNGDGVTYTYVS